MDDGGLGPGRDAGGCRAWEKRRRKSSGGKGGILARDGCTRSSALKKEKTIATVAKLEVRLWGEIGVTSANCVRGVDQKSLRLADEKNCKVRISHAGCAKFLKRHPCQKGAKGTDTRVRLEDITRGKGSCRRNSGTSKEKGGGTR